jgi:RNA polymerase sigma-70 factor (ECF subfamily)
VRRFFLHLTLGDRALSDDLAQDTFLKAYTSIRSFRNLSGFSTWLYRIAYNVFYDELRSRHDTDALDTADLDTVYYTDPQGTGENIDLYRGLATLKEAERTCLTLFYMQDLAIDKIAAVTGYPEGTVKSHLSRGKEKLANYLKQNGYDGNGR